jgi:hypothetical protein
MTPALFYDCKQLCREIIKTHNIRLPEAPKTGRPRIIEWIDAIVFGMYQHLSTRETKKSVWADFKKTIKAKYSTFVTALNDCIWFVLLIVERMMQMNRLDATIEKFTDATDISVCLPKNARSNRVMRRYAAWGHSGKGFYYGLKMTMTRDGNGKLLGLRFDPGNANDRTCFRKVNKNINGILVADAGYVDETMQKEMTTEKRILLVKPRRNMRKVVTEWQTKLYNQRWAIELDFRNLKLFHGLESSLPRSTAGMIGNYLFAVLSFFASK